MADSSASIPLNELIGIITIIGMCLLFFVIAIAIGVYIYAIRPCYLSSSGQDGGALGPGLDPAVLSSLPVLVFKGNAHQFKDGLECSVCLSDVVEGEKARILPKCNHGFHVDCIDMWFQSHSTCPLCRNPVASSNESESPTFPTNDQAQISSTAASVEESASSPSSSRDDHGTLVIDIPSEITEDDLKSPVTGRLRSLKMLLTRDTRLSPTSPDLQQPVSAELS